MTDAHIYQNMLGRIVARIEREGDEQLRFVFADGAVARMYHDQDCCETVTIEEIVGDLDDLVGAPLLVAEGVSEAGESGGWGDTSTWTFYKLATVKGGVTIRWLGSGNGYYSESVDFVLQGAAQ